MKFIYLFIAVVYLNSCCQTSENKEVIAEPTIECSAWEIINQQSDTLAETGYSLFNHYKTNQKILEEQFDDYSAYIKYRVGHKRYVRVLALGLNNLWQSGCGSINKISIYILNDKRILLEGEIYESADFSEVFFEKYFDEGNPFIQFYNGNSSQSEVLMVYDQMAEGYLKALNIYAHARFKHQFCYLKQEEKDIIIREHPLRFYDYIDRNYLIPVMP